MEEKKKIMHIMVLYVIAIVLAIGVFAVWSSDSGTDDWACIQQVCTDSESAGLEWAQQNCGPVDVNGTQVQACQVTVNGQTQVVPQSAINLSAIRNCVEYTCTQEVRVRNVNYTLPPPGQ